MMKPRKRFWLPRDIVSKIYFLIVVCLWVILLTELRLLIKRSFIIPQSMRSYINRLIRTTHWPKYSEICFQLVSGFRVGF